MRRVLLVGGLLAVVFVAVAALAATNLDSWLTANRDVVAKRVESVLGRRVAFEEVGISWAGGLGVRVNELRVGDDPGISEDDFVSAETVDVQVKLWPALFGDIEVARVILRSPRVTLIQTASGLSIDSLGGAGGGKPDSEPGASRAFLVALLDVRDGSLRFIDRTARPPVTLEVDRLDVRASEISFTEPVEFEVSAALFGASGQNFTAEGTFGPLSSEAPQADLELRLAPVALDQALKVRAVRELLPAGLSGSGPVRIDAKARGDLDDLAFDGKLDAGDAAVRFGESFDKAAGVALNLSLQGTKRAADVEIPSLRVVLDDTQLSGTASIQNLEKPKIVFTLASDTFAPAAFGAGQPDDRLRDVAVKGDVVLAGDGPRGSVQVRSPKGRVSGADYDDLAAQIQLRGARTDIQSLTAKAFDGTLTAKGVYELRGSGPPRFELDTQLAKMRIERLAEMVAGRGAHLLSGNLTANVDLNGAGIGWEQIRQVLNGAGELRLADAKLTGLNPAGEALRALLLVPVFSDGGLGRFIQKNEKLFREGDTSIEDFATQFEIREGWLQVRDLVVRTTGYVLDGAGRYSLAGQLDFRTALVFSQALSEELLAAEPTLRYARTSQGQIALPVALRGAPPKVAVVPDVQALLAGAGRELLKDVLTGAAGQPGAAEGQGTAPAPGGVLGGILGKALGGGRAPAPGSADPPADSPTAPTGEAPAAQPAETPAAVAAPPEPTPAAPPPKAAPAPAEAAKVPEQAAPPAPPTEEEEEDEAAPAPPRVEDAGRELLQKGVEGLLGP